LLAALLVAVRMFGTLVLDAVTVAVIVGVSAPVISRVRARARAQAWQHEALLAVYFLAVWDVLAMWLSDRRRAYARIDTIFDDAHLTPPPAKLRWAETTEGEELVASVLPGQSLTSATLSSREWEGKLHDAAGGRCRGVRVDNLEEGGKVRITWIYRDPLASMRLGHAPVELLTPKTANLVKNKISIGRDQTGREVEIDLWKRNILLGGMLDFGKSTLMAHMIAAAAQDPRFRCYGIDLKKLELSVWRHTFEEIVTSDAQDADRLVRQFRALCDEVTERLVNSNNGFGSDQHRPTIDDPGHILFIDEFTLLDTKTQAMLFEVMQLGRACSISVIAATPRPSSRLMDTDTRTLFDTRIAVKCRDYKESNMILGAEFNELGYDASKLTRQGEFMIVNGTSKPFRCLGYRLERDARQTIAGRCEQRHFAPSLEVGDFGPAEQDMSPNGGEPQSPQSQSPEAPPAVPAQPPGLDRAPGQAKVWFALARHPEGLGFTALVTASATSEFTVHQSLKKWKGTWVREEHKAYFANPEYADVAS
jgi:hypothetical protein